MGIAPRGNGPAGPLSAMISGKGFAGLPVGPVQGAAAFYIIMQLLTRRKRFLPAYSAIKMERSGGGMAFNVYSPESVADPSAFTWFGALDADGGGLAVRQDTAGGAVTGSGSATLYRAPHIFRDWAQQVCGESSSNFTTSGFGSMSQAVTDLDAMMTGDYQWNMRVVTPHTPEQMASRIMRQCPIQIYRSTLDGKWRFVVYQQTPGSDKKFTDPDGNVYKWRYDEDMADDSVSVSFTPSDAIVNEVHVRYAYDMGSGQFLKDAFVGPAQSDDGTGTRDENGARETTAGYSRDDYKIKNKLVIECEDIQSDVVAVAIRNYLFDRYYRPRVQVSFVTGPRAIALEPGMVTYINNVMQDYIPCPWNPSPSGTAKAWDEIPFFVRRNTLVSTSGDFPFLCRVELEEVC